MAMKSVSDSDRQQDEKEKKSTRSDEEIGIEQTVAPGEILGGGETAYLKQLKATHRARARAATRWRPRFLKALRMSCNWTDSLKAAHVSHNTVKLHERNDPEFAAQLKEAEEEGAQLLHAVCFQAALQGELQPVYWQGQIVGHIRKYDARMQIELLRAHMPHLFKTPGSRAPVISGDNNNNKGMIMTPERQDELIRLRREALEAMSPPPESKAPNGALLDSGNSSGAVQ
jgi:hypothetical protein